MATNFKSEQIEHLINEALRLNSDLLVIRSDQNPNSALSETCEIAFYLNDINAGPKKLVSDLHILDLPLESVGKYLSQISLSSNQFKGSVSKDFLGDANLLLENDNSEVILGKITGNGTNGRKESSIKIEFKKSKNQSLDGLIKLSDNFKNLIFNELKETSVLLLNDSDKLVQAIIRANKKRPRIISINRLEQEKSYLIENINTPVIITHQFEDPADGLYSFFEKTKELGIFDVMLPKVIASTVVKILKKQCGICAKPTAITKETRERFPLSFQQKLPQTYQFSRGCSECGFTSYRGLTFIESILNIDALLRAQLLNSFSPGEVYKRLVETKSTIYDNAIKKIGDGDISAEETANCIPNISNAMSSYLNGQNHTQDSVPNFGPRKVLIVEDDENQREILRVVFNREGYDVSTAENGKTAISIISKCNPSLIISDIMMPEMNGLELLKFCKNHSEFAKIPILMLTASSNPNHELTMLEEGADDYCPKNVKKKVLLKRAEKLIDRNSTQLNPLVHLLEK